jgi:hypothetical protein
MIIEFIFLDDAFAQLSDLMTDLIFVNFINTVLKILLS